MVKKVLPEGMSFPFDFGFIPVGRRGRKRAKELMTKGLAKYRRKGR